MSGARILIVEDEKIVALEIKNRLGSLGYSVFALVSSGEEALKILAQDRPDLALMDIRLKGELDGIETANQIRIRYKIPVVYLTAYTDTATLQRAKLTEPYGYIIKPFVERELYTTIEMALYNHKMERKLKEREQWFETTLKSISDAVIATNKKGLITFMNPVAEVLTGWKESDALNKKLNDVVMIYNTKMEKCYEDNLKKVLKKLDKIDLTDCVYLVDKNGIQKMIEINGAPICEEDHDIWGAVFVFRDITERAKYEMELQKTQRLESIGLLAGGIAHDFNNILTAIIGNISLAKLDIDVENDLYEVLTDIEKASFQAKNLTQQLLTFSKGGSPVKKIVSIGKLIKEAATFALRGTHVKCKLVFAEDDIWLVEIDEGQISQVIQNVIMNANQAMPDGGFIEIFAENIRLTEQNNLSLKPGKYVKIAIADKGIGIAQEYLDKIFEPYFSTKAKGSGLGLAISYSIIKKHQGHISATSKLNEGSTFYIYLPAAEILPSSTSETSIPIKSQRKGKILVMDDEDFIRTVLTRMLQRSGYSVTVTQDGAEAIQQYILAKKTLNPFDAVILDLTVPGGMGGKQAVKKLREIDPGVKAIVSSGYSNDQIMAEYKKYGFASIIIKPYKIDELNKVLSEVLSI